jgi:hypothetical protein
MHRFSACLGVAAMLLALISAPLFHLHDSDDHGRPGLVHAHFPGFERHTWASGPLVETPDPHEHARWLDFFTLNSPVTAFFHAVAEFSEPLSLPSPVVSRALASIENLRAHSPPETSDLVTRAPPTL